MILTPLQKLPNNVGNLCKIIVPTGFEWLPKKQKKSPNLVTPVSIYFFFLFCIFLYLLPLCFTFLSLSFDVVVVVAVTLKLIQAKATSTSKHKTFFTVGGSDLNYSSNSKSLPVWPEKNRQMSKKVAQKWFHKKNEWLWHIYKNCLRMWEIWTNWLFPKASKSCPKSKKLPILVTLALRRSEASGPNNVTMFLNKLGENQGGQICSVFGH